VWTVILLLALAPLQDSPDELIRRLRSDRAEERDEAGKKLADLGAAAVPALEAARLDKDEEVARRAAAILRTIERRRREAEERKPRRLRSAALKDVPLEDAAKDVFGKFGASVKVDPFGINVQNAVTLELKDAGFWEAVDQFCQAANVRVEPQMMLGTRCSALPISRPLPWPVTFDTIGDVRVIAKLTVMGGAGDNHGDVTAHLGAAFAPWAVPRRARIEGVKLAGQAVEEHPLHREFRANEPDLPAKPELLTLAELWRGGDCVKRAKLDGVRTVSVEGTLVVTRDGVEWKLPFTVRGLPVPPVPDR